MTELAPILARLGLESYHDALVGEGFDTWETVLDIQETDLDALSVKRGHRRKLQREIANYRSLSYDHVLYSPPSESAAEIGRIGGSASTSTGPEGRSGQSGAETKRKYRRHPKPDENAPDRPPSAYVIFSNKIREDLRGKNLSFADIAKLVGERWQKLDFAGKEPFEAQAAAAKERYNVELAEYKQTDAYKEYQQYLADFRAKHAGTASDGKRAKIEHEYSGPTMPPRVIEAPTATGLAPGHARIVSISPKGAVSMQRAVTSPGGSTVVPAAALPGQATGQSSMRLPPISPTNDGLPLWHLLQEPRLHPPLSSHSSISEDSSVFRSDQSDLVPQASRLSVTSPQTTSPLLPSPSSIVPAGLSVSSRRNVHMQRPLPHQDTTNSVSCPLSFSMVSPPAGSALPPITTSLEERPQSQLPEAPPQGYLDYARPMHSPMGYHHNLPSGPLPYSLSKPSESLSDDHDNQRKRLLPPPKPNPSSPQDRQPAKRSRSQTVTPPLSYEESGPKRGDGQGFKEPFESSEDDAVNTLAVMAYGRNPKELRKGASHNRPAP